MDSRPLWRRPWALAGGALIVVVLVVLAWKFAPSGDGAARALNPAPPAGAASASVTPTVLSTAVGTVTGLTAQAQSTAINLRWNPVAGASSYLVRRDPGQPGEVDLAASQTRFGDRPGDAVPHQYAVVAVDGAGLPGPVGTLVHGTATAPYGARQNIASAWTGIIPPKPAARGSAGQTCRDAVTSDAHATGMIGCRFADGVRLDVLSYATATDRDLRADEVSSEAGVQSAGWTAAPGSRGDPLSGRLLASTAPGGPTAKVAAGPWRWWTFDTAPTYAMYAVWPDHSPQDLGRWWRQKAPFRR